MLQVDTLKWKAVFHTRRCASCTKKVTTCVSTSAVTVVIKRSKSKCMMAGAFTSEPANHAKTEWPPVTRFGGKGETANGRVGESSAFTCSSAPTNDPLLWVIDHTYELAKYVFVRVIDCLEFGVTDVAVTNCKLHVHLRFGGLAFGIAELGNECRCVAPLAPCLRYVCANRARRTTNLIG